MASSFKLEFTKLFRKQWLTYDEKTRDLIRDKLLLVKKNPFRYPLHKGYTRVRKVKLSVEGKYQRLMYALHMPEADQILVLGVFERSQDYKDFERKFKHLKKK
ncbi:MAG: hypothetical protein U9M95_06105 [Candidatus Altiarchaeota archaeon]|nr:hypothetical protein [Candidatus Altiarchaeota archaeon]